MTQPDGLFEQFFQQQPAISYEPLMPLSKKELSEWEKLEIEYEKARSRLSEIEAKQQLYWIKMEKKSKIFDRGLKIAGGMLLVEVVGKNHCNHSNTAEGIQGFCSGECDNCALDNESGENSDEI